MNKNYMLRCCGLLLKEFWGLQGFSGSEEMRAVAVNGQSRLSPKNGRMVPRLPVHRRPRLSRVDKKVGMSTLRLVGHRGLGFQGLGGFEP